MTGGGRSSVVKLKSFVSSYILSLIVSGKIILYLISYDNAVLER